MYREIQVKFVLNKLKRRDSWFLVNYTVNPFESCSFNCLYCYVHGSKYGKHLADHLSIKKNAPEILDRQLRNRAKKNDYGIIGLGSATDPYLPIEKELQLTRQLLEIIAHHRFPVFISTKSDLVLRDIDLFQRINEAAILPSDLEKKLQHKCIITFSFSTMDKSITGIIESGTPSPAKRLETMKELSLQNIFTGVNLIPVLPFISDTEKELEKMISASALHGAKFALTGGLTLFGEDAGDSKTMMFKYIEKYHPHLLSAYKEMFDGNSYEGRHYQNKLLIRSTKFCKKYNIKYSIL